MVEVAIRNNGQLAITVPRDSEQLVSVSSITAEELARHAHDLTQEAASWKQPDAYFASANILLDGELAVRRPLSLGRGTCSRWASCSPCRVGITPPRTWLC